MMSRIFHILQRWHEPKNWNSTEHWIKRVYDENEQQRGSIFQPLENSFVDIIRVLRGKLTFPCTMCSFGSAYDLELENCQQQTSTRVAPTMESAWSVRSSTRTWTFIFSWQHLPFSQLLPSTFTVHREQTFEPFLEEILSFKLLLESRLELFF